MLYDSENGNFTIALTGDSMLTRKLSIFDEPQYLGLVRLLRGADACFGNLESTVRGWDEGSPAISRMGRGTLPLCRCSSREASRRSCCISAGWARSILACELSKA